MPDSDYNSMRDILGADGALATAIKGFRVRSGQIEMAEKISGAIKNGNRLIVESGTGTGKTFAYLAPIILSGQKALISTGTRHLQDQLFQQDLPVIARAMNMPGNFSLLKGRSNYLCIYRLHRAALEGRFRTRSDSESIHSITEWSSLTRTGDISEVESVSEDSMLWPTVTSTVDNCIGSECEHFSECFVVKARRDALEADIVVINHHLFFADLMLQEEGFGRLLPNVDTVIFDEAHQLVDTASRFFSKTVSSYRLKNLCRDVITEELIARSVVRKLEDTARSTEKSVADFRLSFGSENTERGAWNNSNFNKQINGLEKLAINLQNLHGLLEVASVKSKGLANCFRRATDILQNLQNFSDQVQPEYVPWFETSKRGFNLHMTPIDIADAFQEITSEQETAWVFVSATLAVNKKFNHFQDQLGLADSDTGIWDSPFNYQDQTMLYLPRNLPEPNQPEFTQSMIQAILPLLEASGGRTFLLFTSYRALNLAAKLLATLIDYPILVQGDAPRTQLLGKFRALGNAVLLGTGSFWEGVDVRGQALTCVIIDKLPFASPGEPVLKARCQALEEAGINPFFQFQVPNAVISLKQGAGRLIRDEKDRGVLVLCDPRLLSKGYGKSFLNSLPAMPQVQSLTQVTEFLKNIQ